MACCPWSTGPAVDFVTPTLGRHDVHEQLYKVFDSQTIPQKRLFVLDETREASRFLSRLNDRRVTYIHAPNRKITGAGQGGIAAARNRLMRMTSAPFIAHLDDDDWYDPRWAETMLGRLHDYDIAKLAVWNMQTEDGSIYQWDTRLHEGKVWAIKGGEPATQVEVDTTIDPQILDDMRDAWLHGFGFSYVFRRSLWERVKFPEDETCEDVPWIRKARKLGARINLVSNLPHLCLHVVHPRSGSVNFPQRKLPRMAARMTGALPKTDEGWALLPAGKGIKVEVGMMVSVVARLKDKYALKSIFERCSAWNIEVLEATDKVSAGEYGVEVAPGGYRLIHIVAKVNRAGTVPWAVPAPLNVFDKSSVLKAWQKAA